MTQQPPPVLMVDERYVAMRALKRRATEPAEHNGRQSTPIEEQHRLLAMSQRRAEYLLKPITE